MRAPRASGLLVVVAALGCGHVQATRPAPPCETLPLEVHLLAGKTINLNPAGQAMPVQVRVLLLKDRELLDSMDFDTVWREGDKALAAVLVGSSTVTVVPGEEKISSLAAPASVRYVALVGLFRQPDDQDWKHVVDIRAEAAACRVGSLHIPVRAALRDNRITALKPETSSP